MTATRPKAPAADTGSAPDAFPFPTSEHHGKLPAQTAAPVTEEPTEDALDHGIEESFPASDPVSVRVTKVVPKPKPKPGNPD